MEQNNYFDKMEEEDYIKLVELNDHIKWFDKIERNEKMDRIDIDATDKRGRKVNIELKSRLCTFGTYPTIFIEEEKYDNLMRKWENNNEIPLYINFFFANKTAVWDLRKFKNMEKSNITIFNKGKNIVESVTRYNLPIEGCILIGLGEKNNFEILRH